MGTHLPKWKCIPKLSVQFKNKISNTTSKISSFPMSMSGLSTASLKKPPKTKKALRTFKSLSSLPSLPQPCGRNPILLPSKSSRKYGLALVKTTKISLLGLFNSFLIQKFTMNSLEIAQSKKPREILYHGPY
jgi:hypothetical protein